MKKCFKCGKELDLEFFYTHNQMKDGHLNKCIECTKNDSKERAEKLSTVDGWVEKERARGREKYKRLGYSTRSKELNKDKPWKHLSKYKGLRRKYKLPRNYELHHWSYKVENLEDVFIVDISVHRKLHRHIKMNPIALCFETLNGELLDTKEIHLQYLKSIGFYLDYLQTTFT